MPFLKMCLRVYTRIQYCVYTRMQQPNRLIVALRSCAARDSKLFRYFVCDGRVITPATALRCSDERYRRLTI